TDVPAIREEDDMPPWRGVASQMVVSFFPPGGSGKKGFENWNDMARWEGSLFQGQRDPSPEISRRLWRLRHRRRRRWQRCRPLPHSYRKRFATSQSNWESGDGSRIRRGMFTRTSMAIARIRQR